MQSDSISTPGVPTSWRIGMIVFALVMVPGVAALGGYSGSFVGKKWPPRPARIKAAIDAAKTS